MKVAVLICVLVCVVMEEMALGALPPAYVRSAKFVNACKMPVQVKVTFDSGDVQTHTVAKGGSLKVEKLIDRGSYKAVDAITNLKVTCEMMNGEEVIALNPQGVERHEYVIEMKSKKMSVRKTDGAPSPGGLGALPPAYVRSAKFENECKMPVQIKVTFASGDVQTHTVAKGASLTVEKLIDNGSSKSVDAITNVKVTCEKMNAEEVIELNPQGIERHEYVIGMENKKMAVTKTEIRGLPPAYVRSAKFVNACKMPVQVKVTFDSGDVETHTVAKGGSLNVEKLIDNGSSKAVDAITNVKVTCEKMNAEKVIALNPQGVERHEYVIGMKNMKLQVTKTE